MQPEPYWRRAPLAASPRLTDLCDNCGHVRWRHTRGILRELKCYVLGCDCGGSMNFGFREARYFGALDTFTNQWGYRVTLAQPCPPINRPELGRGSA